MARRSRYRVEGDTRCIDIRLKSPRHVFDNRDPAPFRERDLDPQAVEHLLTAAFEIRKQHPIKVVLHFSEPEEERLDHATLREAFRAHFEHELDLADRRIGENFRRGQRLVVIGLSVLGIFLMLAELTTHIRVGPVREVLREGLTITGWVAMWRPVEVLLYDWIPLVDQRRGVRRILGAEVEIRLMASSEAIASASPVKARQSVSGPAPPAEA